MSRIYKADEVEQSPTVRSLSGLHTSGHQPESDDTSAEKRENCSAQSQSSQPPAPSDESLQRIQRVLSEAVADFQRRRDHLLEEMKPDLVTLVMEISGAVIEHELQTDREAIMRVVERAVAEVGETDRIILRVHPDDARLLETAVSDGTWTPPKFANFDISADTSIRRGGCVLESDRGQVDATIEAQLDEIEKYLRDTNIEGEGQK